MKKLTIKQSKRLEACFGNTDQFIVVTTRNPRTNVKHVKVLARRIVDNKLKTVIEWESVSFWTKVDEFLRDWGSAASYAINR